MAFNAPYEFKQNKKHIVLRHRHGGHLRTSPQNLAHLDGEGGQGANAQWIVHLEGGHHCRLQNVRRYALCTFCSKLCIIAFNFNIISQSEVSPNLAQW